MNNLIKTIAILFIGLSIAQAQELKVKLNANNILMLEPTNSNENVLLGLNTGVLLNVDGLSNTMIGDNSGSVLVEGQNNVFLGSSAGRYSTGNWNTILGTLAGSNRTSGNQNTILGGGAGRDGNGSKNIYIGYEAGLTQNGDHHLYIENTSADSTEALIYGQFDNNILRFNAHTDIYSNSTSDEGLHVVKSHTGSSDIPAIKGQNILTDFYGVGVEGEGGWIGVRGNTYGEGGGFYFGVAGNSLGVNGGTNYGVVGEAKNGSTNYGIYGLSTIGPNSYAGYFDGNVNITNDLTAKNTNAENLTVTDALTLGNGGINFNDTDTGNFNDDDIINKTTQLTYCIALSGVFPSSSGSPISNDVYIGEIRLFPYSFIPGGWAECNGQELSINDYASLFSLLGLNYGGNGTTTFKLPDMRNAVPGHN